MEEERPHEQIAVYQYQTPVDEHKSILISVEKFDDLTDYKIYVQGITEKNNCKNIEYTLVCDPDLKNTNNTDIETATIELAEKMYKMFQKHHVSWRV